MGLTAIGQDQARALRARLAGRRYAGVWSSDLRRAAETARLAYGMPMFDARLREIHFGALEGLSWDELSADQQAGLLDFDAFVAPGGESFAAFRFRIADFVEGLDDGEHLVFTHGGVIRLLLRLTNADEPVAPGTVHTIDRA